MNFIVVGPRQQEQIERIAHDVIPALRRRVAAGSPDR
jgi:hypothetical protein